MTVMKGSLVQCLKHFAQAKVDGDKRAALKLITKMGADTTMRRWLNQGKPPKGEPLIRLMFYFDFLGYEVSEMKHMTDAVKSFGRIITFCKLDLDDAAHAIGAADGEDLLPALRGVQGFRADREAQVQKFNATWATMLEEGMRKAPRFSFTTPSERSASEAAPVSHHASSVGNTQKENLIKGFAFMVLGLLQQADFLLSDSFTPEDRKRMRQLAGEDGVFRLSNRLNRLCGERARHDITSK